MVVFTILRSRDLLTFFLNLKGHLEEGESSSTNLVIDSSKPNALEIEQTEVQSTTLEFPS